MKKIIYLLSLAVITLVFLPDNPVYSIPISEDCELVCDNVNSTIDVVFDVADQDLLIVQIIEADLSPGDIQWGVYYPEFSKDNNSQYDGLNALYAISDNKEKLRWYGTNYFRQNLKSNTTLTTKNYKHASMQIINSKEVMGLCPLPNFRFMV